MKYYVATSSLNIENILSTESISPASSYKSRSFGYQSFNQLDELKSFNCIMLFSVIPHFFIEDEQRENYPMIIQIDDDLQLNEIREVGEYCNCKIYAYAKTIHITPRSTQFYFFTDKARILSYHNCLDSKMCKLVDYFQFATICPSNVKLRDLIQEVNDSLCPTVSKDEDNQNQYNRVKGFICGYYIGAIKSLSINTAKMLKIQKRIYDIVASIENNKGQGNAVLNEELVRLDKEYMRLDPTTIHLKKLWDEFANNHNMAVEKLDELLLELNVAGQAKRNFCKQQGLNLRNTLSEYQLWDLKKYCNDISLHIHSLISRERDEMKTKIDLCSCLDINPDYSLAMMSMDDDKSNLFNKILSRIIWDDIVPDIDSLRINRFDIATKVTETVRQIFETDNQQWDGSVEQLYFHHLRQNIGEFSPFNLQEIDNVVLQSLATFLLKGEDFEGMISYFESNSMPIYQYALALWGATLGYVQIPRTIISSSMSKSDFENLYRNIYKLMYRRDYAEKLETNLSIPANLSNVMIESRLNNNWRNNIDLIIAKNPRVKISDKDRRNIDEARQLASDEHAFITILASKIAKTKTGIFPKLKECFYPDYQSFKRNRKERTLFDTVQDWSYDLPDLKCFRHFPSEVQKRLSENWNYTAKDKEYMSNEHINHFLNLCKKEGAGKIQGSRHQELKGLFTEEICKLASEELKKLSNVNR